VQKINGKQTFSFTSLLTMRRRELNLTFTPLTERYVMGDSWTRKMRRGRGKYVPLR